MANPEAGELLHDLRLLEYEKLKDEQTKRIEYRDHMVHVHLAIVGAAFGWAIANNSPFVLLVVPWICLVLGWAYLVNDERVSALGRYIREDLTVQFRQMLNDPSARVFGWETAHRSDDGRRERKFFQLVVDEIEFFVFGILALAAFVWLDKNMNPYKWAAILVEAVLLAILAVQIFRYADLKREKDDPSPTAQGSANS